MRKCLIIFLVIVCCGCSAKYNMSFIDNKISDELVVSYEKNGESNDDISGIFSGIFSLMNDSNDFYYFKNLSTKKNVVGSLNYEFDINNYDNSYIPNSCFSTFEFLSDEDKYYLLAQGTFKCGYYAYEELDSLDVIINTNHVVLENNADEVKDNKYIWHISTYDEDVNIRFVVKNEVVKNSYKINYKNILIISGCVVSVLAIIGLLMFARYKRVNKI